MEALLEYSSAIIKNAQSASSSTLFEVKGFREKLQKTWSRPKPQGFGENPARSKHKDRSKSVELQEEIDLELNHYAKILNELEDTKAGFLDIAEQYKKAREIIFHITSLYTELSRVYREEKKFELASKSIVNGEYILELEKRLSYGNRLNYGAYLLIEFARDSNDNSSSLSETRISETAAAYKVFYEVLDEYYCFLHDELIESLYSGATEIIKVISSIDYFSNFNLDRQYSESIEALKNSCQLIISIISRNGFSEEQAKIISLYPNKETYDWTLRQRTLWSDSLPELIAGYSGKYVLFEDGEVLDSDEDEETLLERIWASGYTKERINKGVFVDKVKGN